MRIKNHFKENKTFIFFLVITLVLSLVLHTIEVIHYEGAPVVIASDWKRRALFDLYEISNLCDLYDDETTEFGDFSYEDQEVVLTGWRQFASDYSQIAITPPTPQELAYIIQEIPDTTTVREMQAMAAGLMLKIEQCV